MAILKFTAIICLGFGLGLVALLGASSLVFHQGLQQQRSECEQTYLRIQEYKTAHPYRRGLLEILIKFKLGNLGWVAGYDEPSVGDSCYGDFINLLQAYPILEGVVDTTEKLLNLPGVESYRGNLEGKFYIPYDTLKEYAVQLEESSTGLLELVLSSFAAVLSSISDFQQYLVDALNPENILTFLNQWWSVLAASVIIWIAICFILFSKDTQDTNLRGKSGTKNPSVEDEPSPFSSSNIKKTLLIYGKNYICSQINDYIANYIGYSTEEDLHILLSKGIILQLISRSVDCLVMNESYHPRTVSFWKQLLHGCINTSLNMSVSKFIVKGLKKNLIVCFLTTTVAIIRTHIEDSLPVETTRILLMYIKAFKGEFFALLFAYLF